MGAVAAATAHNAIAAERARSRLADEQAALRRVATLVAGGAASAEVFTAVADELARLFGAEVGFVARLETADPEDSNANPWITIVGSYGRSTADTAVGMRFELVSGRLMRDVVDSGEPIRVDGAKVFVGPLGARAAALGLRSGIGAPIKVDSRTWGLTVVGSAGTLPPAAPSRIADFTELAAMAIANTETDERLRKLADTQKSLRRLALLVAQGEPPQRVFSTVTKEVLRQFADGGTGRLVRYELDGTVTVMAAENVIEPRAALVPSAGMRIHVDGRLWGRILVDTGHGPLPPDLETRMTEFTDLVATAVAGAQSRTELTSSRARIVEASDETRRRIERDLHDGVQQSLVALALRLRSAAMAADDRGEAHEVVTEGATDLTSVVEKLRELSHGIHPVVLYDSGLLPALHALRRRAPVPMKVDIRLDGRPPTPVEAGAYYVVSEMITNAAGHATASIVYVEAGTEDGMLLLRVRDDGTGGADKERVPGGGTLVTCRIPI